MYEVGESERFDDRCLLSRRVEACQAQSPIPLLVPTSTSTITKTDASPLIGWAFSAKIAKINLPPTELLEHRVNRQPPTVSRLLQRQMPENERIFSSPRELGWRRW